VVASRVGPVGKSPPRLLRRLISVRRWSFAAVRRTEKKEPETGRRCAGLPPRSSRGDGGRRRHPGHPALFKGLNHAPVGEFRGQELNGSAGHESGNLGRVDAIGKHEHWIAFRRSRRVESFFVGLVTGGWGWSPARKCRRTPRGRLPARCHGRPPRRGAGGPSWGLTRPRPANSASGWPQSPMFYPLELKLAFLKQKHALFCFNKFAKACFLKQKHILF